MRKKEDNLYVDLGKIKKKINEHCSSIDQMLADVKKMKSELDIISGKKIKTSEKCRKKVGQI